ncbi:hypothetical protein [Kitasatospora sp. NPDC001547]|uniref:hypothetical protein n=1 Tax=Kitasatospora sp. NPDC001547 TaxID=3364015 RepID=UPI0036C7BB99|nr:hypothetical protein KitaXyl93_69570 [Kitasatospora sp. Xyl93]
MLLLGLLLMAASGAFVGLLIADNLSGGPDYQVTILGNDLVTLNSLSIFLAGVALALIFCLGLAMMRLARRTPRRARRARPVAAPVERERTLGGTDDMRVLPEDRAAEQGGRETAARPGGRIRHMFGH